jgi:hypothetical protein
MKENPWEGRAKDPDDSIHLGRRDGFRDRRGQFSQGTLG